MSVATEAVPAGTDEPPSLLSSTGKRYQNHAARKTAEELGMAYSRLETTLLLPVEYAKVLGVHRSFLDTIFTLISGIRRQGGWVLGWEEVLGSFAGPKVGHKITEIFVSAPCGGVSRSANPQNLLRRLLSAVCRAGGWRERDRHGEWARRGSAPSFNFTVSSHACFCVRNVYLVTKRGFVAQLVPGTGSLDVSEVESPRPDTPVTRRNTTRRASTVDISLTARGCVVGAICVVWAAENAGARAPNVTAVYLAVVHARSALSA